MAFIGFGSPDDLLREGRYFDIRKEWARAASSSPQGKGLTESEYVAAFEALQEEFADSGDVRRWLSGERDRGQLLRWLARITHVSTGRMPDRDVEIETRAAVRFGKLVIWPGHGGLLEHVRITRAKCAAASHGTARPPMPAGAPSARIRGDAMTPSQLRKQMGAAIAGEAACKSQALAAKASRWRGRKQRIAGARERAARMPLGQERERLEKAANRFELNNSAVEQARLASHVYHPDGQPPPEGWTNISKNSKALARLGLRPSQLIKGPKTIAQVYQPDPRVFGADMPPQVVFQGTDPGLIGDYLNDGAQALNIYAGYYQRAVKIGESLIRTRASVQFVGHSLGGGLAAAASATTGLPATTINAAGLHPSTVASYSAAPGKVSNIHAFYVKDEPLTRLQNNMSPLIPIAVGIQHELPGGGGVLQNHGIVQAIDGFEAQKREDQALIVEGLKK